MRKAAIYTDDESQVFVPIRRRKKGISLETKNTATVPDEDSVSKRILVCIEKAGGSILVLNDDDILCSFPGAVGKGGVKRGKSESPKKLSRRLNEQRAVVISALNQLVEQKLVVRENRPHNGQTVFSYRLALRVVAPVEPVIDPHDRYAHHEDPAPTAVSMRRQSCA